MGSIFLRLRTWWETADRTQRVVTIFGSLLLVALVGGTLFFSSRPQMGVLYSSLNPADQGLVADELQLQGVRYQIDPKGAILVDQSQLAAVRAKLATAGKLPTSGRAGYADLATMGIASTPAVERERIRAALEGELAKSIETFSGVSSARVHLTLGNDSPFVDESKPASASITLVQAAGSSISPESSQAAARLVANAVPGLEMKNVSVIAGGRIVLDGSDQEGASGLAARKVESQREEERRREQEIQQKLDAAFGPGSTIVDVDVEMNFDEKTVSSSERSPSEQPITTETNEEQLQNAASSLAGGVAGAATNMPGAPTTPAGGSNAGYIGKRTTAQYEINEVNTISKQAPGAISRLAISVLVDREKIKDPAQVEAFLNGQLGSREGDPKFSATVTPVAFDRSAVQEATKASAAAQGQQRMQQMLSLLPVGALLLVGFLVIKAIGKTAKSQPVMITAGPAGATMAAGLPARYGTAARRPAQDSPALPRKPSEPQVSADDIDSIPDVLNVPLEQIKKMAGERPHSVAMLVKTWMLEDRR